MTPCRGHADGRHRPVNQVTVRVFPATRWTHRVVPDSLDAVMDPSDGRCLSDGDASVTTSGISI